MFDWIKQRVDDHSARYRIESVGRACRLLEAFLTPPHRFGVTELSRLTGMSKNLVFRLLQTLAAEGLVIQEADTRTYALGYRLAELGAAATRGSTLVQVAGPVLDMLAEEVGETINLIARADATSAICIDKRESSRLLRISAKVGARFPLHAGATPKLLLAFSSPAAIEHYLRASTPLTCFTARTITEPGELMEELAQIRRQGYSVSDEDLDLGACAIAAPICNRSGEVIAGVSIAAPTSRFGPTDRQRYRGAALAAAREITQRLGGTWAIREEEKEEMGQQQTTRD